MNASTPYPNRLKSVTLLSTIHIKVCPPTIPSDAVLFFCVQVSLFEIFCILPLNWWFSCTFHSLKFSPSPFSRLWVLWPRLTPHSKLYSVFLITSPHVYEASRGKTIHFHARSPPHLHSNVRVIFGLRLVSQPHPIGYA